ncbi:MAG: protein kinase [Chitinivibrionales bacterium]|nr:protein kinase [Chitinivibrionales bacterium]
MLTTTFKNIDSIVAKIGDKLPIRLTFDAPSPTRNSSKLKAYFARIRDTFRKHRPPVYIGDHIGTGGFADVFLAQSDYDGVKDFAIKILRKELTVVRKGQKYDSVREEMRVKDVKKRFRNESFMQWHLGQSLSPRVAQSIVQVYDHGEFDSQNDFRFILMEQMGKTLRDFIANQSNFADSEQLYLYKARLMLRIAEIIQNVHEAGIFHRDIKPENILFPRDAALPKVDSHGRLTDNAADSIKVKLGDFGTVRWVKSIDDKYDGVIIGSQFYMSPEQIFHPDRLDLRTDIYSFGVVCYELFFGFHPKNVDNTTVDVLEKLARRQPVPVMPPHGLDGLYDIILTCMKDIYERYQTMKEVCDRLRSFIQSRE